MQISMIQNDFGFSYSDIIWNLDIRINKGSINFQSFVIFNHKNIASKLTIPRLRQAIHCISCTFVTSFPMR